MAPSCGQLPFPRTRCLTVHLAENITEKAVKIGLILRFIRGCCHPSVKRISHHEMDFSLTPGRHANFIYDTQRHRRSANLPWPPVPRHASLPTSDNPVLSLKKQNSHS